MWRVLAPGGVFFCRLASSIGMEDRMRPIGDGRFHLPDGSVRYLVDEARLMALTDGARRRAARSAQDHHRPGPALHDDVGRAQD